ncbi:MAG: hypothetical protein CMJ46_13295 [Planctomyces sp.]|nr:hypothetical protein [Planctomyces sp.]
MTPFSSSQNRLNAEFLTQRDQGDRSRTVILFLHGVTRCWQTFTTLMNSLSPRFIPVGMDFPGHGASMRLERYLVRDHVDALIQWLREDYGSLTGRNQLILYGHSLGGMVATAVAAELPGMVEAIVLEDPPFDAMGQQIKGTSWQTYFAEVRKYASLECTQQHLYEELTDMRWEDPSSGKMIQLSSVRDEPSIRFMARCLHQLDPNTMAPIVSGDWLDGYCLERLSQKIGCPTLILQGDPTAGGTLLDRDVELLRSSNGQTVVKQFPQAGHLLHQVRLTEVMQTVSLFLESFAVPELRK